MTAHFVRIMGLLAVAPFTLGATITVDPGESIQAAIDTATNGDEIVVAAGTYHEVIDFLGKAVTLRSSAGASSTIIDGSGLQMSVVTCKTEEGPDTVLEGFTIQGGEGTLQVINRVGGGMFNDGSAPTVRDCVFAGNSAHEGGGMYNFGSAATVSGCTFVGNVADGGLGGGAILNEGGFVTIVNCVFADNTSDNYAGGVYNYGCFAEILNCQFHNNTGVFGGAMANAQSLTTVLNCTFADNSADVIGGALMDTPVTTTVSNSILWNNSPDEIWASPPPTLTYSNIMGGWNGPGSNNIDSDPLFIDVASGDLRLSPGSPSIDAGDDSALPIEITTDLDGNPRFVDDPDTPNGAGGIVDIGAYEFQAEPIENEFDVDGDGMVAVSDLLILLAAWGSDPGGPPDFNEDGVVDTSDLLALLANWG